MMKGLLRLSRAIDALNEHVGRLTYWLILAAVLISAGNAVVRYTINMSSNAWLEIQWYLFSFVFLFCAGYTLLHNQHVRIDVISGQLSGRARAWIDIFGTVFFLMPMAIAIMWVSWPGFLEAGGLRDHGALVAGFPGRLPQRRGFHQCGSPDGVARASHAAGGLLPPH